MKLGRLLLPSLPLWLAACPSGEDHEVVFEPDQRAEVNASAPGSAGAPAEPAPGKLASNERTGPVERDIAVEAPADGEVRFVAYNLWNYLSMERSGRPTGKPEQEINAVLDVIESLRPDILGVCEIGTEEDLTDLQRRLASRGIDLPHRAWATGQDGERNLGLLSAYPIVSAGNPDPTYQLRHYDGSLVDTRLERGILDVVLQLAPDYRLHTLGVHFKSKGAVEHADQEVIRTSEAALLREHVETILAEAPDTNLLVYGDFNDTIHSRALEIVRGPMSSSHPQALFDLRLEDSLGQRWTHYWSWQDTYTRFDYLLVNRALDREILDDQSGIPLEARIRQASDHRPIYATIDVTKDNE